MKKHIATSGTLLLTLIILLASAASVLAESSVWKAVKGGRTVYLGGTIHLLRESDYPLPSEYDAAYRDADVLVFETNIDLLDDPVTQTQILMQATLPDQTTLEDILLASTYETLREYCAGAGLPIMALNRYKPSLVVITLLSIELQKMGITEEGIDAYYANKAKEDGKELLYLEDVEDQIGFVLDMGEGNEDEFVLHSIEDMKKTPEKMEEMIGFWRGGLVDSLETLLIEEMATDYPDLYEDLIVLRNDRWLPQIEKYFRTSEKEFVLVGAAHLVGPDGLIGSLRDKGYTVEKVR